MKHNLPYCARAAKQCKNLQTWTIQKGQTVKLHTACKVLLCVPLRNYNLCLKDYTVLCLISELIYDFEVEHIGLLVP